MLDWNDLRHFLAVHRAGNLSRAAGELGLNATTVSRRLSALEEALGTRLFDRTPDGYLLTSAGRDLLPRAERMEQEALALEREVVGADGEARGVVRVTATEMLATRFIAPHIAGFTARHPDIVLDLHCTNEVVSLARREADIALRLAKPREDNVVTRQLSEVPLALYASAAYLEQCGTPAEPEHNLDGHQVLLFANTRHFRDENDWLALRADGARVVLRSDSVSSIYAAVTRGLGIALLPRIVADHDPRLTRIATRTSSKPRTIWMTVHRDMRSTARVRVVMDFLAKVLRAPDE